MIIKTYNVLVLDNNNSVASIMAEALFNTMGEGVYRAYSAGTQPLGVVNRYVLEPINRIDYPTSSLRSKGLHEFAHSEAPKINFLITLGNHSINERLPAWLNGALKAHWDIEEPTVIKGSFEDKKEVFRKLFLSIQYKIDRFTQLPLAHLNQIKLDIEMAKWR